MDTYRNISYDKDLFLASYAIDTLVIGIYIGLVRCSNYAISKSLHSNTSIPIDEEIHIKEKNIIRQVSQVKPVYIDPLRADSKHEPFHLKLSS